MLGNMYFSLRNHKLILYRFKLTKCPKAKIKVFPKFNNLYKCQKSDPKPTFRKAPAQFLDVKILH